MTEMLQHLVNGLSITGVYVLGAVGFNLLFGVLKIANFAHGAFVALGAYTVLLLVVDAGTSYMVAIVTAIVVAGMGGVILERGLLRFTGSMELVLVGTLGVASFMEEGLLLWVGGDTRTIPTQVNGSIDFADLHVQNQSVATILVSVVTIAVLSLVLYRTLPGRMVPRGSRRAGGCRVHRNQRWSHQGRRRSRRCGSGRAGRCTAGSGGGAPTVHGPAAPDHGIPHRHPGGPWKFPWSRSRCSSSRSIGVFGIGVSRRDVVGTLQFWFGDNASRCPAHGLVPDDPKRVGPCIVTVLGSG